MADPGPTKQGASKDYTNLNFGTYHKGGDLLLRQRESVPQLVHGRRWVAFRRQSLY